MLSSGHDRKQSYPQISLITLKEESILVKKWGAARAAPLSGLS
jgi:hypothetical protein